MPERDYRLYFSDISESCQAIFEYIEEMSFEAFCRDRKTYSAVIREFEIIGEAVGKLPDSMKSEYKNIDWQDIKDFRNLLIHEYFGVDLEIVWKIIQDDLPNLSEAVNELLKK
ncbi:MAG: DUF86 domain-containing protein [Desulfobacterales bacterium]|nr:DUF86 domain-containing protein [Desulfobacterales bacterium]